MSVLYLTMTDMAHHPWHYIRDKHPDVTVEFTDSCGQDGCLGRSHGKTIEIDRTSNQRERRGTLTHETHHHERGPVPQDPYLAAKEERTVELLTAQTLITIDDLIDALVWNRFRVDDGTATDLWIDFDILLTRVQNLTDDERAHIDTELRRRSPWTN